MNLMKDRLDDMEGWEDIEHNIENSVEKHPNSNRERFIIYGYFQTNSFNFSTSTDPENPITAAEAATRQNVRFAAV